MRSESTDRDPVRSASTGRDLTGRVSAGRELAWRGLTGDDLPAVAALAARCLAVDGGLPLVTAESFLRSRFAAAEGIGRGATDPAGTLVVAGAVRPQDVAGVRRATFTGLVDPAYRGRGAGAELLDWGLATAGALADRVAVETESLTDPAAALFAARGLRRVFAEDVLCRDLTTGPPTAPPTDGPVGAIAAACSEADEVATQPGEVTLLPWSVVPARRFFEVYRAAFADRPGFPDWPEQRWVDWTAGDDGFRPKWSLLAVDARHGDIGFITCADGWIVQVGVRPDQRGRGTGAVLVIEALRRMWAGGTTKVLLDVQVDNPAGRLYRRLGFARVGRRARFESIG